MTTSTASGRSVLADTTAALEEAISAARRKLLSTPQLGFVFAPPRHQLEAVRLAATGLLPETQWLACSSGGGLDELGFARDAVVVFLIASTRARLLPAHVSEVRSDPAAAAAQVCAGFAEASRGAREAGLPLSTTLALVDGLAGVGETFVKELRAHTRSFQQIVGGASADDGAFKETPVAHTHAVEARGAVVVHTFDRFAWGVGVEHGLTPATPRMTATKTTGTTILEIDGRPAIEGKRFGEELDAVRRVFPDTPIGGFVTYGEIARFSGRLDGWHNATIVVVAIPG